MTQDAPRVMSPRHRMLLALLSLAGTVLILLSTSRYGAGLSPDSVGYVATARNIAKGAGAVSFDGTPLVAQPVLYPALLATAGVAFRIDPLASAPVLNALIFGLIVYLSGLLVSRHLPSSSPFAIVGLALVLLSAPLQGAAVMAWSEPLFVLLVLLFLLHLERYLADGDSTSLVLLTAAAALACLTRYIGATLILSGVLALLLLRRGAITDRVTRAMLFAAVAALPAAVWTIRNHAVSGTLVGSRGSAEFTFWENLRFTFDTVLAWYLPTRVSESRAVLMAIAASVGLLAGLAAKGNWSKLRAAVPHIGAMALFVAAYTALLILASTTTAYDRIGDRLLSPVYIPATLLLLILAETLVEPFREHLSLQVVKGLLVGLVGVWLLGYPLRSTVNAAVDRMREGAGGFNTRIWKESALVQHLQRHPQAGGHVVYSNAPDALYILAGVRSELSPARTAYGSSDVANAIGALRGTWPKDVQAVLVWSDAVPGREKWLFSIDELGTVSEIQMETRLGDGAVYRVSRVAF